MSDLTLLDRYRGAMVGVHIGDAIGAPYEKAFSAKQIAADIEARGGLKFFDYPDPWAKKGQEPENFPAGRPTDDSDQTADLAWSLIQCNGLDTVHLREALRDSVVRGKSRLWSGVAKGAGGTTRKALSDDPEKVKAALQNNIGTNGSLMRSVPMALWIFPWFRTVYINGKGHEFHFVNMLPMCSDMSKVTHSHEHSKQASSLYSTILCGILAGYTKEKAVFIQDEIDDHFRRWEFKKTLFKRFQYQERRDSMWYWRPPIWRRIAASLEDKDLFPIDPGNWPARGTAEFSLYAALWCLQHSTSFADGIEKAVRIGGDTDTYAAIAGGLLGAYYGYDGIPFEWRDTILGHDVMVEYADKLYEMHQRL